eukprot:c9212_g1_i2.p1 GENE.c9212_g1_i2~~c9212_g1_i2.p1  ORF type:complete len:299 (+),score=54.73 c9212_g1_i2:59-898(+)
MKFRCQIHNPQVFLKVCQALEKVGKIGILHFSQNSLHLINPGELNDDVKVWASLIVDEVFRHYQIESLSDNNIGCHVLYSHLIQALKSCQAAEQILVKLTKKENQPMLFFQIDHTFPKKMTVTHSVPVQIMSSAQVMELKEPTLPTPEIQVYLPSLKELKTTMERMKSVGEHLVIDCTPLGEMSLNCTTDVVNISTVFRGLELAAPCTTPQPLPSHTPSQATIQAQLSLRKFSRVIKSCEVFASQVICCLVRNQAVVMLVPLGDGSLNTVTYYIPLVLD